MDTKVTARPESVRKRPLELTNSNNGDTLPTKFKTGPTPGSVMDCTAQFEMEQKVHDVEEHFRRSLQSFQSPNGGSSFLPVSTTAAAGNTGSSPSMRGLKKKSEDEEPHQIVITENNTSRSSITTSSPQNVQFIMTSSPSSGGSSDVPTVISALPGAFPPSFFLNISSTTDKTEGGAQLLTAAPALSAAARKGGGGGGGGSLMVPAFQGMIPTIAPAHNLIPVIDNSGTPQLIPATSTNTTTPISGTSPVFYMSPSGIPMLTQGGVVFMNPTDITRSQHLSVTTPPQHNSSNVIPNYIILPPTFAANSGLSTGANFSLTLDQLVALNNLQQQHIQQQQQPTETSNHQRVNIDLTASDDHSSVGSGGSMDDLPDPLPSSSSTAAVANSNNVDSVEEHFARALGDQWHQLKQSNATPLAHSDHNKITA